ncbi:MAG: cyclase family protein [Solirubrobacterales bacterium]
MPDFRAHFDARVTFANGGGLTAEGFRLDLPTGDETEAEVGRLFVTHLGLAMVGTIELDGLQIVKEQHKGSRAIDVRSTVQLRRIVDLSHVIHSGLVTYHGLPAPTITPHLTREASKAKYAQGTTFAMDSITMIGNTGTYLDSPFHRYAGGADLAGLDLATLVDLPAEVFHLTDLSSRGISAEVFLDRDLRGTAVLLHTGFDRHFGTPVYGRGSPFLEAAAVEYLLEQGVALVGIDALNIDDTESGGERPAHSGLLAAGIHVVEHLTRLGELPTRGARFTAAPPAVRDFGTFPVRAFAIVPGGAGPAR